jgi:CubicO group peptidase (beta-lactamase class C family)
LTSYSQGFGFADINSSVPVTPETLYFTGSTTKSFTAAALALLIDHANASFPITFRTPISSLLREDFVLSDEWATAHTTIEDALSHRTGYPSHDLSTSFLSGADLAHNLRNLPMATEPRTTFMYNNIMFGVLGHLVSVLSGESLVSFFRRRLWKAWGMNNTYLGIKDVERHGKLACLATEYFWNNDTAVLAVSPHMVMQPAIQGAGAIISSVDDYSRYLRAMMKEAAPVSKAGHAALKFPHSIIAPELPPFTGPQWYGLGWFGSVIQDAQIFFHAGQVNQFVSYMFMMPSRQFAAVIMVNTATIAHEVIALRLIYDHFGVAEKNRYNLELESVFRPQTQRNSLLLLIIPLTMPS